MAIEEQQDGMFLGPDPNAGGFLTNDIPFPTPTAGQISTKNRKEDLKHNTGLTEEELSGLMDANAVAFAPIPAQELAPAGSVGILEALVEDGATLEELEAAATKKQEIEKALTSTQEMTSVDLALAKDPTASGVIFRVEHRAGRVRREMFDLAEEFEGGWADKVVEFVDQIGYDTFTGMRDVVDLLTFEGGENVQLADQWQVALSSYSDEEFEAFYRGRMEAITDRTIHHADEASWRVLREIQAMETAGAVLWGESTGALVGAVSALDLATLGVAGVKTLSMAGRSVVGRLRSTVGTTSATDAATGTALVKRSGIDGDIVDDPISLDSPQGVKPKFTIKDDIIDAEFIDDMVPSSVGTRVYPDTPPPPVSAGKVSQAVAGNMFVRRFLQRQAAKSFGTVNVEQKAADWAKIEADRLAKASGTNVIDFDVTVEGIQQAKTTFKFGRDDALPFKTKKSAEAMAGSIPNAKVVPVKGKEGVEYVIEAETRVPLRDTVYATDMNKVKARTRLGRLLGRADIGSNTFMSNLADSADYGAGAFLKDFEHVFKQVGKLPKNDVKSINEILTSLRDTPNGGNSRTWLTEGDFASAYAALNKGAKPSKEVLDAYGNIVQASDFAWYVRANDRLATMANQKAVMVQAGDFEVVAFPTQRVVSSLKGEKGPVWVWDAALGKRVNVKTLGDNAPLLELSVPMGNKSKFVTNFYGKTRVPELEDAFPYNAGGPRTNPEISWFVGNDDGNWATLIGARSQKDAQRAETEFNNIADAVFREIGEEPEALDALTKSQKKRLNAIVAENNRWNPNIENIDDFLTFTKSRGVPANKKVHHRERGARLGGFVATNDESLVNLDLESYISFTRHDQALVEFGGQKASNPDPVLAIHRQYNQMVSRGAQTQYRMHHPSAWVKAVQKAHKDKAIERLDDIVHPMTDEMKVKTMKIKGNTPVAEKLRQEQSVILRRLEMFEGSQSSLPTEGFGSYVDNATTWAGEALHNFGGNTKFGGAASSWLRGTSATGWSNTALSLGFFQKMASPDQVLLQSAHIIPLTAISPRNGMKAAQMAGIIRQAARAGDESLWRSTYMSLKNTTGLSEEEMNSLMTHLMDSGRGYMKGAIAEDPMAGMGNSILGKVKDISSIPYYAGENFSATASRITAFLDTRKSFPSLDPKSDAFWRAVTKRDRDISFGLNKAQKSEVQTDAVTRVLTQWTSYQLRTLESILHPQSGLGGAERARLAFFTTALWGLGGMGMHETAMKIKENETFGVFSNMVADGADAAIDGLLGIKVGSRVAFNPIELFERAFQTSTLQWDEAVPAITILSDTALPALSALQHYGSGRIALGNHDIHTLTRAWKVVDGATMAWSMQMNDVRRSKSGASIEKDWTTTQKLFQALGIQPSEAAEKYNASQVIFDARKRREKAIDQSLPAVKLAIQAGQEGNYRKAQQFMLDANAIVEAYNLPPVRLAEVREAVLQKAGFEDINWLVMQMIKDGYEKEALKFKENFSK